MSEICVNFKIKIFKYHITYKKSTKKIFLLFHASAIRAFISSSQLTWRDIQHLTVLTSKRNSLFDAKDRFHWTMNGVGLEFNHLFGYGVLDAGAMVALAKKWKTVPPRYHCEAGSMLETQ